MRLCRATHTDEQNLTWHCGLEDGHEGWHNVHNRVWPPTKNYNVWTRSTNPTTRWHIHEWGLPYSEARDMAVTGNQRSVACDTGMTYRVEEQGTNPNTLVGR